MTQEVFIKAFDQLPATDAESFGLRPWLYRVATNACFNHLRSRRKLDGGGDAGLEQAASGVDEFERAQTVALVEQSLGEMNERYRTALVLKDLQGLAPEEIAEVMEVSRPTADVLVHRARASFKSGLREACRRRRDGARRARPRAPASQRAGGAPGDAAAACPSRSRARAAVPRHLLGHRPHRRRPAHQDRRRAHDQGGDRRRGRGGRHRRRRRRGQGGGQESPRARTICSNHSWRRHQLAALVGLRRTARSALGRPWDAMGRARRGSAPRLGGWSHWMTAPAAAAMTPRPTAPGDGGGSATTTHDAGGDSPSTTHDGGTSSRSTSHSDQHDDRHDGGDTSGSHDGGSGD